MENIQIAFEKWLQSKGFDFLSKKRTDQIFSRFINDYLEGNFNNISLTINKVENEKRKLITDEK